ncbi:MAG: aminopeptidase [Trichlorobacter sp.]
MHQHHHAFSSLFSVNMGHKSGERIVVFSDTIRADETMTPEDRDRRTRLVMTARSLADYAMEQLGNSLFIDFPATLASGVEPPEIVWRAIYGNVAIDIMQSIEVFPRILSKKASADDLERAAQIIREHADDLADIVIALSNNSTSHTNFRKLACSVKTRFASLPHFEPDMFNTSMCVDWQALSDRTERLVQALNTGDWIHVSAPNGTNMHICKEGRWAEGDDGILTASGSFGNLPAGEAYLAPLEGKSHGKIVLEWGPTAQLQSPLTLTVQNGIVVTIEGGDPLRERLESLFTTNEACRNLAELGIGTNDKASRPDNVLEAEKILGTIHLALGDNMGFGGTVSAPFHEDYVIYNPTVTVKDGSHHHVIIDAGRFLI